MHISYQPEVANHNRGFEPEITWSEKVWQFIRFTVVTGMIFSLSFVVINFSAYKEILVSVMNPNAQAQAAKVLENSAKGSLDSSKFLQLLPDEKDLKKTFAWMDQPIAPTDNRLIIPKLGKSVPLVEMTTDNIEGENWTDLEKQIQQGLQKGVVHYPGTARPGQNGNFFITGHSSYYPWDPGQFKDVFALLGKLDPGDRFYVYYDQMRYEYAIYDKFEVQPDNVEVLKQPNDKKMATLMTCTPVGTALRRLIIQAEEIS